MRLQMVGSMVAEALRKVDHGLPKAGWVGLLDPGRVRAVTTTLRALRTAKVS